MLILHAAWSDAALWLWAEDASLVSLDAGAGVPRVGSEGSAAPQHPFAASAAEILAAVAPVLPEGASWTPGHLMLWLPAAGEAPVPSPNLCHAAGHAADEDEEAAHPTLKRFSVTGLRVAPGGVCDAADAVDELVHDGALLAEGAGSAGRAHAGASIAYLSALVRLVRNLMAQQRFVPSLRQEPTGDVRGVWAPWLADEHTSSRAGALLQAMPHAFRAGADGLGHDARRVLTDFVERVLDSQCRRAVLADRLADTLAERDPLKDMHVAWLQGLLGGEDTDRIVLRGPQRAELVRGVSRWLGGLEDRGQSSAWRLCFELVEPVQADGPGADPEERARWPLTFHLQSVEHPHLRIAAEDVWLLPGESATIQGQRVDGPQHLLLAELGRASRVFRVLERALHDAEPTGLELSTRQAYDFLREQRPVLIEQGFGVVVPEWWDGPGLRVGARLKLSSPDAPPENFGLRGVSPAAGSRLGLAAIVDYSWQIELGGASLTLREFEELASRRLPLVRLNGRWVEIRPDDVEAAIRFIREHPGGRINLGEALRLAYGTEIRRAGLPVVGLEAQGWVGALLGDNGAKERLPIVDPPRGFRGTLRPYQIRGVSWLSFIERLGFGPCLADDMGLGKTIQVLAALLLEREQAGGPDGVVAGAPARVPPTLLIVPTSVVGNWIHESARFAPSLKLLIQHGPGRAQGDALVAAAERADLVVTTYALAYRDREHLSRVPWWRVVLDEAQSIKNPQAKQAQAVRSFDVPRRVALTGTPVENRLSELWSIMEFLNPGFLGTAAAFRQTFSVPIERYRDPHRSRQLRSLIQPFVLRRLKTDPSVVADLPPKVETREYSHLTPEQASLYESCVSRMLTEIDRSEGMQRRGLVLATLVKLKQVCDHPSLLLKDHAAGSGPPVAPGRSGKCVRLIEMLEEVLASGEQALVFTQFRQMGHLLAEMLRHALDREILFLHGGTTRTQRQSMIDRFQSGPGAPPVLILSLKAGGVGLNLAAATHVFHFDRWWNPAVENQATDRAYRIGQSRRVQVHKFVVRGTLEERIDEMIEQKTALAQNIIGAGEQWLTELSTEDLRSILSLRSEAVGDEE